MNDYKMHFDRHGYTQIDDKTDAHYILVTTNLAHMNELSCVYCTNSKVTVKPNFDNHDEARKKHWPQIFDACSHSLRADVSKAMIKSPQRAALLHSSEGRDFLASIWRHRFVRDLTAAMATLGDLPEGVKDIQFRAVDGDTFRKVCTVIQKMDGRSLRETTDQDCEIDSAIARRWKTVSGPDFESERATRVMLKLGQLLSEANLPAEAGKRTVKNTSGASALLVCAQYRQNLLNDPSKEDEIDLVLELSFLRHEHPRAPPIPQSQADFMSDRKVNRATMLQILTDVILPAYRTEYRSGWYRTNTPWSLATDEARKVAARRLGSQVVHALKHAFATTMSARQGEISTAVEWVDIDTFKRSITEADNSLPASIGHEEPIPDSSHRSIKAEPGP